ncbi:MAG: PQQ-binding-like beta-propeller repeat protein, partial [Planctomycetota bacterium]
MLRALLLLLTFTPTLAAQENRPLHNTSFVPADDETTGKLVEEARKAVEAKDYAGAAELLQQMMVTPTEKLLPIRARELFTSVRRWAQMQLLAERDPYPRAVLDAWRTLYDERGSAALLGALAAQDEDALLDLLDRYPAARAAPIALLALSDRALQRGDRDAARGFLLRVPEHVARTEEKAFLEAAPYKERRAFLARHAPTPPAHWPTIGGDATRSRNGDALPPVEKLKLRWATQELEFTPNFVDYDPVERASPQVPFHAIADAQHLYVSFGTHLAIIDRRSGAIRRFVPGNGRGPDPAVLDTLMLVNPGRRGATVQDGVVYFPRVRALGEDDLLPDNELLAYDTKNDQILWRRGRFTPRRDDPAILRRPIFYRGAPAVVGGRLYVYGAIREQAESGPTRREQSYLFCFDRIDGRLLWHRFLGSGDTEAPPQLPPISGLAPAVSQGVVVVVTGLGVAAALDARSGEFIWLYRYDRHPEREQFRLMVRREQYAPRRPGWKREAPRILGNYVHFAPVDGDAIDRCWLRGRRRIEDGRFTLVCWSQRRDRDFGRNCLLEYVAGLRGGRGYYVGVRDPDQARYGYENVVSNDLRREYPFRFARLPAIDSPHDRAVRVPPELFGRPILAGGTLLLPTRRALFAFDLDAAAARAIP